MSKPTSTPTDISTYDGCADFLGRKRRKNKTSPAGKGDDRREADERHCTREQYEANWDQIDWSK